MLFRSGSWIIATGIGSLVSSGLVSINQDQMVGLLTSQINDFILNDRFAVVENSDFGEEDVSIL